MKKLQLYQYLRAHFPSGATDSRWCVLRQFRWPDCPGRGFARGRKREPCQSFASSCPAHLLHSGCAWVVAAGLSALPRGTAPSRPSVGEGATRPRAQGGVGKGPRAVSQAPEQSAAWGFQAKVPRYEINHRVVCPPTGRRSGHLPVRIPGRLSVRSRGRTRGREAGSHPRRCG